MKFINLVLCFLLLLELSFFVNGENFFMSLIKKYSSSEAEIKGQSQRSAKTNEVGQSHSSAETEKKGQSPSSDNNVQSPKPTNNVRSPKPTEADVKINNKCVVLNVLDHTVYPHVLFVANHFRENIPGVK